MKKTSLRFPQNLSLKIREESGKRSGWSVSKGRSKMFPSRSACRRRDACVDRVTSDPCLRYLAILGPKLRTLYLSLQFFNAEGLLANDTKLRIII